MDAVEPLNTSPLPASQRSAGDRADVQRDPVVAAAPPGHWRAWLTYLVRAARLRQGEAALLLVAAIAVEALLLGLFGELADQVSDGGTVRLDNGVYHWLRSFASPGLDEIARLVSTMGAEVLGGLLVLLLVYFGWRRRWGTAVSLLIVTGGAQLLNNVLKDHFHRTRPAPTVVTGVIAAQTWSFPSGHAMVSAAFYLFLAYVGWRLLRGTARRIWVAALVGLVLLIGLSRMYLGAHYLTDVVAGYLAGACWTEAVIGAGRLLPRTRRVGPAAYRRGRSLYAPSGEQGAA